MTATEKPAPAADDTGRPTAHDDAGPPSPPTGHVIVYGVRGVGLRTVEQLHAAGSPWSSSRRARRTPTRSPSAC